MGHRRNLFFFLVLAFILTTTYLVIMMAKGYKVDLFKKSISVNGLLVATSVPDGAQIFVNSKLASATNTTISLAPGQYLIEIKKDGFSPWSKNITIQKELVVKTDTYLFSSLPNLKALTFTGVSEPVLSPDDSKVVYKVNIALNTEKNGLWIMDLTEFPFGILKEPRMIAKSTSLLDLSKTILTWSPDSKSVIATFQNLKTQTVYIIDSNNLNPNLIPVDTIIRLPVMTKQWNNEQKLKEDQKMKKLPPEMIDILENKATEVSFAPDETRVLYVATTSAQIGENLIPQLPGSSTQQEERNLKPNRVYVYDIKEDRNFFIAEATMETPKKITANSRTIASGSVISPVRWFPTSKHLYKVENNKVTIMEYDNTNKIEVYNGEFIEGYAFPFPSGNKLLILTKISTAKDSFPNLYVVGMK